MSAYDQNIVIDLEFTATRSTEARARGLHNEIVEIGAVKLDSACNEIDRLSVMVKPRFVKGVSGFVHALTGICDSELVSAPELDEALARLARGLVTGVPASSRGAVRTSSSFARSAGPRTSTSMSCPRVGWTSSDCTRASRAGPVAASPSATRPTRRAFRSRAAGRIARCTTPTSRPRCCAPWQVATVRLRPGSCARRLGTTRRALRSRRALAAGARGLRGFSSASRSRSSHVRSAELPCDRA